MKFFILYILIFVNIVFAQVPTQWIGKLYSEALGRSADSSGWNYFNDTHFGNTCDTNRVHRLAIGILTSPEFLAKNYGNNEKVLIAYRTIYGIEPTQQDFNYDLSLLNSMTWSQFINLKLLDANINSICSNTLSGWGTNPAVTMKSAKDGDFHGGTGSQLQVALDSMNYGQTLYLSQRSIIKLTQALVIPSGVKLKTKGLPGTDRYASMARIVRASNFNDSMIKLMSNSEISNVWVDGQKDLYTTNSNGKYNIFIRRQRNETRSDNIVVSNNKITNTPGGAGVSVYGTWEANPCSNIKINNNLITSYSQNHYDYNHHFTDGIRTSCEDALITYNEVIDATDVGIIVFRSGTATQNSKVLNNIVTNVGNSAYGGIVIDQLYNDYGGTTYKFTGTVIANNKIWAGKYAHMDTVLGIGTKPWFGNNTDFGEGPSIYDNTTGGISTPLRTSMGISVSNMKNVYIQNNNFHINAGPGLNSCPYGNIVLDSESISTNNSNIQGGYVMKTMYPCMSVSH